MDTAIRFIVAALILAVAPGLYAQNRIQRERQAEQLLNMPENKPENAEVERVMMDSVARTLFKRLRADQGWTADHHVWQRLYPEFLASLESLSRRFLNTGAEQELKAALVEKMTEAELAQILAIQSGPEMAEARSMARKMGVDLPSSIRLVGVVTEPAHYSQAEKDEMRSRFAALKGQEREIKEALPRLEAAMQVFRAPAFAKYQQVLAAVLRESLNQLMAEPAAVKEMQDFATAWRGRVAAP